MLAEIERLHPALLKLFAVPAYRLPDDVRAHYVSDRSGHAEEGHVAYVFDLLLLRASCLTWISVEFDSYVVERRSVKTWPLSRLASVETKQGGVSGGPGWTGCVIELDDATITLPFDDPDRIEQAPSPGRRTLDFAKAIHDVL
ncbi:MAG TPA: hypothetical protein VEU29_04065 [Actinomycetota bacterium]|nr:hypothetical protein [Actinomycetota bacterium]